MDKKKSAGSGRDQAERKETRGEETVDAARAILGVDLSADLLREVLADQADLTLGIFFGDGRRWSRLAPVPQVSAILALREAEPDLRRLFEADGSIEAVCTRPEWYVVNLPRFSKAAARAFVTGVHDACGAADPW